MVVKQPEELDLTDLMPRDLKIQRRKFRRNLRFKLFRGNHSRFTKKLASDIRAFKGLNLTSPSARTSSNLKVI